MLTSQEKALIRMLFRVRIYEVDGQAYEDLFTSIMVLAKPTFRQIKPQGKYGDMKNDGYISAQGEYYQVYAPEDFQKQVTQKAAINKAIRDFEGLYKHWSDVSKIRKYYFVVNDKYKGVFPALEKALTTLKKKYNLSVAEPYTAKDLERTLLSLDDDQILSIIQVLPVQIADETDIAKLLLKKLGNKRVVRIISYLDVYSESGYAVESVLKIQDDLENIMSNIDPDTFLSEKIELMIEEAKRFLSVMQENCITKTGPTKGESPRDWWDNYFKALTTFREKFSQLMMELSDHYSVEVRPEIERMFPR